MSVFLDISAALDDRLNTLDSKAPKAWENRPYKPVNGTMYLRQSLIPGDVEQATLGETGTDRQVGIYQIDVFTPSGKGGKQGIKLADKVANHFKRGTDLTYNSRTVRVRSVGRETAVNNDDGWLQIPVVITYVAYTEAR